MTALDFPNSPTLNQVFTSGGRSWIWNGSTWVANSIISTGGLFSQTIFSAAEERWNVSASGAPNPLNLDVITSSAWLYTGAAGANWTLNVRGNSTTTLDSILATGDSITVAAAVWMTTARVQSAFQIDGSAVTVRWQGGTAPSAGNADSFEVYTFTIVKTASVVYTVFGSRTQFK